MSSADKTITREEVIEKIKFLRDNACNYYLGKETENALEMALEALKQPEIIKCKNCCFYAISKEKRSWCKDMLRRIQPEDFCSHAKIK